MKKIVLAIILAFPLTLLADEDTSVDDCIAGNSGAESVDCLKEIYQELNQELEQLNRSFVSRLEQRDRQDIITTIHYQESLSAFKRSILDFKLYRKSSCDAQTYYSGAVASGYGQVLYRCLITQTKIHNQFLKTTLKK